MMRNKIETLSFVPITIAAIEDSTLACLTSPLASVPMSSRKRREGIRSLRVYSGCVELGSLHLLQHQRAVEIEQ